MFRTIIYSIANILRRFGYSFQEESDERVQRMKQKIAEIGGAIDFDIHIERSTGNWVAEATNLAGIITGGKNYPEDTSSSIKDAIFTYFEIPPYLCNDKLLRGQDEAVTVEDKIYVGG